MTEREATILASMEGHNWLRPLDFGGNSRNGYSTTAQRMRAKGWVEGRTYCVPGDVSRCTWNYRITDKGLQALANHKLMRGMA